MSRLTSYDPIRAGCSDGSGSFVNDKAQLRAVSSAYKPSQKIVSDPNRTIFIGRLNLDTKEEVVESFFKKFGKIKSYRLVRDIVTGLSRGYAFIEFERKKDAESAAHAGHHAMIDGNQIIVEMELERILPGWKPRRLGGGLGGNKRSGQLRFGGKELPFRNNILSLKSSHKHTQDRVGRLSHPKTSDRG
ncbi:U11/U12 small nuclear ribonucleoprotein 35 kDa protein-like [Brevipalpus obovatus]|uniref:U11/U12 small nuclear ribonucleoprotein 35 kDa protein-like n=1 Tax=Brevipalpus obovatus TaxID=246614 RepID=UPI003D9EBD7A